MHTYMYIHTCTHVHILYIYIHTYVHYAYSSARHKAGKQGTAIFPSALLCSPALKIMKFKNYYLLIDVHVLSIKRKSHSSVFSLLLWD